MKFYVIACSYLKENYTKSGHSTRSRLEPFNMHVTLLQAHCMHVTQLQNGSALACNGSAHKQCPTQWFSPSLQLLSSQIMHLSRQQEWWDCFWLVSQEAMAGHVPRWHMSRHCCWRHVLVPPLPLAAWLRGKLPAAPTGGTLFSQPCRRLYRHCHWRVMPYCQS